VVIVLSVERAVPISIRVGIALAGVCLMFPGVVAACDCVNAGPPCKAFKATPNVFTGRVTRISTIQVKMPSSVVYPQQLVQLQIERNYRGQEATSTLEVVTGEGGGDCGFSFEEGKQYLVYAYPHAASGKLYTGICQRTRLLSGADEDLEYLANKDDPAHGAGIEGSVEQLSRDQHNITQIAGMLAGVPLEIAGDGRRSTAVTGTDGKFRVWGLKPGSYRITAMWGKKFVAVSQTVTLEPGSCVELRFLATPPPVKNRRGSGARLLNHFLPDSFGF
jgi:hypothetical protein